MEKKKKIINEENISVTDNAAKRVNAILIGEKKEGYILRNSVVGGGCSGMSYILSFDNKEGEFDKIYHCKGIKIVCDVKSWFYVKGTEIDFSMAICNQVIDHWTASSPIIINL